MSTTKSPSSSSYDISSMIEAAGFRYVSGSGGSMATTFRTYVGPYAIRIEIMSRPMGGWHASLYDDTKEVSLVGGANDRREFVNLLAKIGIDVRTTAQQTMYKLMSTLAMELGVTYKITGPNSAIINYGGQRYRITPFVSRPKSS